MALAPRGGCVFSYDLQQKTCTRPLGDGSSGALRALDARHDAEKGTLTWLTAGVWGCPPGADGEPGGWGDFVISKMAIYQILLQTNLEVVREN